MQGDIYITISQDLDPRLIKGEPNQETLQLVDDGEIALLKIQVYSEDAAAVAGKPARIWIAEVTKNEPTEEELERDSEAEGTYEADWSPLS